MRITVVIPTFRRPVNLLRALDALQRQSRLPDEVLIALRDDDAATRGALLDYDAGPLVLGVVPVGLADASEARNRCLDRAIGDVFVMTDDDTVAPPEWLAAINERFLADPALGGLGGPDWIGGHPVPVEVRPKVVGAVQWWGRRIGNHHRGSQGPRTVEWLKGANMSFRRLALRGMRFGRMLRGSAAQFGEDFAMSLGIDRARWKLMYDPAVWVDHFPGALTSGVDHRKLPDAAALTDASHNETVVLLRYLSPGRRAAFLAWSFLVGTRLLPGFLMAGYLLATRAQLHAFSRCFAVWRGRLAGYRTWRASLTPVHRNRTAGLRLRIQ